MTTFCPFCWEEIPKGTAAFRCTSNDQVRCPREPDEELRRYQRASEAPQLPPVTPASKSLLARSAPKETPCRVCGERANRTVCPACHNDLPVEYLSQQSRSFSVIGAKESGKSHYLAVLVEHLTGKLNREFRASLSGANDMTRLRYRRDFYLPLYEREETLEATRPARADAGVREPLIFRLQMGNGKSVKAAQLVFFDTAGEDLAIPADASSVDTLDAEAQYIAHTDATLLLIDPLQIPSVREDVPPEELPSSITDPLEVLARVTDLIRRTDGIPEATKIDRPLALAFSKVDAIRNLIGGDSPVFTSPDHEAGFNLPVAGDIEIEMRDFADRFLGSNFNAYVDNNWSNARYFGLSALGRPPVGYQLAHGISQQRVEDPVLWFLSEWGLIATQAERPGSGN